MMKSCIALKHGRPQGFLKRVKVQNCWHKTAKTLNVLIYFWKFRSSRLYLT